MITLITLLPILLGVGMLIKRQSPQAARMASLGCALLDLLLVLVLAARFDRSASGLQFVQTLSFLPALGVEYKTGVDGISLIFVLLAVIVFLMSFLVSWSDLRPSSYHAFMLMLMGALLGTFTAQNFIHFFFYWELCLIPAWFLIREFAGVNRSTIATQFFIYTMLGSIAMLLGFLALSSATGSLDFSTLAGLNKGAVQRELASKLAWSGLLGSDIKRILFILVFLGFAVKLPLWPLHGWQPVTYSESPSTLTMVLTGVMSKMAVYGMLRILVPIFPDEMIFFQQPLLALAVITILYGALNAIAQQDIKRLFAFSSLSHLGYCAMGIFAAPRKIGVLYSGSDAALSGVLLQAFSHGILASALFAGVWFLEKRSAGSRVMGDFGGLRNINPVFAGFMGILIFASLGLPGLSAFPAEFLIFQATFSAFPVAASFAAIGILLTAVYSLTFFLRVFLGPLNNRRGNSPDLLPAERIALAPALLLAFALGIAPQLASTWFNSTVAGIVKLVGS